MKPDTFWKDLAASRKAEQELKHLLEITGYHVTDTTSQGRFEGYDLVVKSPAETTYIEVKHDLSASKTGNVAVELFKTVDNTQKPSGLSSTKADLIAYKIGDDTNFYVYKPSILQSLVDQKKYKTIKSNAGQGGRTTIALFDVNFFKDNSNVLNYEFLTSPI